jgi:murein L,D-transpeptidase YcbB/YkuD
MLFLPSDRWRAVYRRVKHWNGTGMAFRLRYLLAAGALTVAAVMPGAAVHAQNLFDFFFQPQRQWAPRYYDRRDYSRPGAPGYYGPEDRYAPDITVKSPKYRNYVPDAPTRVALDKICQFKLASHAETGPVTAEPSFAAACAAAPTLSLRVLPQVGAALSDYYSSHPKFLWVENDAVNDKARAVMATLAQSGRYGLTPADYRVALPAAEDGDSAAHTREMMRFELTLSAKVLTYVLDATRGRVDPNRMSDYYDLPRKKVDLAAAMGEIAKSNDVVHYLDSRNPDNSQFRVLVTALAKARAAAPKRTIVIPAGTFIRPGERDPALPQVITAIRESSSTALKEKHAKTLATYDGGEVYGPKLVALVRDFQHEKGLNADGIVGRNTIQAMRQSTPADRIKKLTLAMERLRWLPRQFGKRYVLLNEPAFQVTFIKGDGQPLTMRAIVGKPNHQTYFFADTIKSVEYNPYWNVPRSIVINEMLPRLYSDPYYLDRLGYEVINTAGQQVSSGNVDWDAYARNRVSVDVRQLPGPRNALGLLKIEFPNKHAIYMHDTPQKYLFKNQRLAFSHGCVRLEHPRVMAAALLGKPVSYIDENIATGQNFNEQVGGNIPVYLTYFTAWPDNDGAVHYYADVYGRDGHLSDALAKTEAVRAHPDS